MHTDHLIRHLTVTPSPTGEGNRKALFRQQIYTASVGERLDATNGSLVQRELSAKLTEGLYFFEFFFLQSLRLALARHLPLHKGGLGDFTSKTPHPPRQARHLLPLEKATVRRYSNNRFLMKLLTEEWVKLAFSCERRGTAIAVDE